MSSIVEIRLAAHQSDDDQAHQLSLFLLGNGKVAYRSLRSQQLRETPGPRRLNAHDSNLAAQH